MEGAHQKSCAIIASTGEKSGLEIANIHVPYLAYRRGDIDENIRKLNEGVNKAQNIISETKEWANDRKNDVDMIVKATREAAASAGVATFTAEFESESSKLDALSIKWLRATIIFAALTVVSAVGLYYWPEVLPQASGWDILRNIVSKTAIIAILFTGTIWCGRNYRSLIHQAAVNRHRSLSLKTFQAFVEATEDPYVKDAVLMAATRTVFANVSTGFIEQHGEDQGPGVNFVEFGKRANENMVE